MHAPTAASTRRDFLRAAALASTAAALPFGCGFQPAPNEADSRPNLIIMMADDMGFSDIGCYGGEIQTPRLDQLASNGLRFKQFYNGARCCPTRAQLMTGLYAHQAGVGHMMTPYFKDGEPIASYAGDLSPHAVTIAEVLRPAGYTTLMSGKWHVTPAVGSGDPVNQKNWPVQRGFDRFYGTIHGAGSFYDPASLTLQNDPVEPDSDDFYYTDAIGDHASQFIREAPADKPFFLYMPFTSPHWPLHAPDADVEKVKGRYDAGWDALRESRLARMREISLISDDWPLSPRDPSVPAWEDADNKEWESRRMEVYAAQIEVMDRNVGKVVDTLADLGKLDNTLILFLADNGGCAEILHAGRTALHFPVETRDGRPVKLGNDPAEMPGQDDDYQSYGPPWANTSNTPFRYYKHWVHEGGISSPLIAHWPAGISETGGWTNEIAHLIDLMATCADLGQADYPAEREGVAVTPLEGKSLAPVFRAGSRPGHDAVYWEHEGNRAIRQGKWKLVSKWSEPENGRWELYDMEADRSELNDLAADNPEKVAELSALWQTWADKVGVIEWRSWDA